MPAGVEIGLLGPLQVRCEGVPAAVPAGQQRALLAALLLQAGRPVPVGQLAELLWAPGPPPLTAPVALRNSVARLRRLLGPAGRQLIQTRPGGYLIMPGDCELDLAAMERELAAARAAARDGDWQRAAARSEASLSLWRGEPLSDVDLPALTAQHVPRLNEMRLQARELRIDAYLALARQAEAVTELPQLIAANPVRERLYALLMLALYRCGRRAEALDAYRTARHVLAGEIGVDPGPELQALHQQILHDDPALAAPPAPGPRAGPSGPPARAAQAAELPRQLPAAVACFTGRDAELAALTSLLGPGTGGAAPALVISAIGGTAGVGKTALAVQWAHQVAERFPDGQLYANLRGYDPSEPVAPADALAGFLRTLGVAGQEIPDEMDERARLYRTRLAGRRILVLLDNARDGQQVRPLLPGDPGCVAVVTSRDALAGLVAADGARRLDLDVLPLADAVALLRSLTGGRVDDDPEAAAELAGLCARLPLALRIAAELAAARQEAPLRELAAELAASRLDCLDAGEDRADVRAVFSWSFRQLPDDVAETFALTGLHPGIDLDAHAAAALTGTTPEQARRVLGRLHRASLIQASAPGRYSMHDLLRAYAAEQAAARDGADERAAAVVRLLDYYLHTAAAAMATLFPAESHRLPCIPPPGTPVPTVINHSAASRAWLDTERANLVELVRYAAHSGWPSHATRLAATLSRYLDVAGHYTDAVAVHTHARSAASQTGDRTAEATALTDLGAVDWRQGRYEQAARHLRNAMALSRQTAYRSCEARALTHLGLVDLHQGRYLQAADHFRRSVALGRQTSDKPGQARALGNLGVVELRQGRYTQAARHIQQALALHRVTGNRTGEAHALGNLGDIDLRLGRYQQADDHFQQALAVHRQIGDPTIGAYALTNLGIVAQQQGRYQEATCYHEQALALFRETGNRSGEAGALNGLGEVLLAAGRADDAGIQHATALGLAAKIGEKEKQARAHLGLARAYSATSDPGQARHHWRQALVLYTSLGSPEAEQIRDQFEALSPGLTQAEREQPPPPADET